MIRMSLQEVAAAVDGTVVGDGSVLIDAVATDSRDLPAGAPLFLALPGEQADGHDFVPAAMAAGAVAALVRHAPRDGDRATGARFPFVEVDDTWQALRRLAAHVRREVAPTSVAVTGSVGKTTVKDLAAAAVGAGRRVHASRGSFNNELGVPLTLLGLTGDTEVLVAEVGARHIGDIAALAPLVAPDVAVVTAVAGVHLEIFGTIDAVARAKAELVAALGPTGTAVLNVADPRVAAMAGAAPRVLRVATDEQDADVRATDIRLDRLARASATVITPWGTTSVTLPVAGRHQITNALLALAVAGHLGVDLDDAAAAIGQAVVSPWRGDVRTAGAVTVVNDAYNANPLSMVAALDTMLAIERSGRTVAILGVMGEIGEAAEFEHRRIGRACATRGVDQVIVVGEDAVGIAHGAREAGLDAVTEVADPAAAVRLAAASIGEGDVVLVKGSRVAGLETVADELLAGRSAP